jgi:hypothetical protein
MDKIPAKWNIPPSCEFSETRLLSSQCHSRCLSQDTKLASMAQFCLLDFARLSKLLEDALSWSPAASSLLVSARNGSILAYAFRSDTPSIKDMRTLSTTMTAAYTAASENTLVYESQSLNTISIIGPIADHILLAVTGARNTTAAGDHAETPKEDEADADTENEDEEQEDGTQVESRLELESISEELATILREELRNMRWPDDI